MADNKQRPDALAKVKVTKPTATVLSELGQAAQSGAAKPSANAGQKIGNIASSVLWAAVQNPKFWQLAGSLITKANHPDWYGGGSNAFTTPIGPYVATTRGAHVVLANSFVYALPGKLIDFSMVSAKMKAGINGFDKKFGFTTNLQLSEIENYLYYALNFLAAFATIKRFCNSENVSIVGDVKLGDRFGYIARPNVISGAGNIISKRHGARNIPIPNISKHSWESDYVSEATSVLLKPEHFALVSYLFDSSFSNGLEKGVNSIIEFVPWKYDSVEATLNADLLVWHKAKLDAALQAFQNARNANKYIEPFLRDLGYQAVVPSEWCNRDSVGKTNAVAVDPSITIALANMFNRTAAATNKLVVRASADVDPSFDHQFDELTIGEFGSLTKFQIMDSELTATAALVAYRSTAGLGTTTIQWNAPGYALIPPSGHFYVGDAVDEVDIKTNVPAGTLVTDQADIIRCAIEVVPVEVFMGVERFSLSRNRLSWKYNGTTYVLQLELVTDDTNLVDLVGCDVAQVSDFDLATKVVKVNFTMGINYRATINQMLDKYSADLILR